MGREDEKETRSAAVESGSGHGVSEREEVVEREAMAVVVMTVEDDCGWPPIRESRLR